MAAPRRAVTEKLSISEQQLNELVKAELRATKRPGLKSSVIKLYANNYISTYSRIDFDEVEREQPGSIPPFLKMFLSGRKDLLLDFRFRSDNGTFTWAIEKAYLQQLKVPPVLMERAIEIVAARQPEQFDASKPLPLPFGVKEAWTGNKVLYLMR